MTKVNWESFWSVVGKLSILVGLIWASLQLINFITNNDYKLQVIGDHTLIRYPAFFEEELEELQMASSIKLLEKSFPTGDEPLIKVFKLYDEIDKYLDSNYPKRLSFAINTWRSFIKFYIKNTGKKEINKIKLEIPFDGYYEISSAQDKGRIADNFNKKINIGSLNPSEEVEVFVWTTYGLDGFFLDGSKVTHENGVVKVQYSTKITGWRAWLFEKVGVCLPLLCSLLGGILIFAILTAFDKKVIKSS